MNSDNPSIQELLNRPEASELLTETALTLSPIFSVLIVLKLLGNPSAILQPHANFPSNLNIKICDQADNLNFQKEILLTLNELSKKQEWNAQLTFTASELIKDKQKIISIRDKMLSKTHSNDQNFRDQYVINELKETINIYDQIAMLYGANHSETFEKYVLENGFGLIEEKWFSSFYNSFSGRAVKRNAKRNHSTARKT